MGIKPADHRDGRRIGFSFEDGSKRFYDIDADDKVYWLRPAGSTNKITRYRVQDAKLANWIREQAKNAETKERNQIQPATLASGEGSS